MPLNSGTVPVNEQSITGVTDAPSTTVFSDDAGIVVGEIQKPISLSASYYAHNHSVVGNDIQTFMAKPRILTKGIFQTTDVSTSFLPFHLPKEQINTPIYMDKLRGYFGFRATTVFTIQFNATRFQQGRYMLTWVPLAGSRYSSASIPGLTWVDQHSATLTQRTQLPRVEFDLACDTSAQLKIPFASALDFYPLASILHVDNPSTWGVMRIYPYSALQAVAGPNTASYTVWVHFEDLELIGPSVPQDSAVEFQANNITSSTKRRNPSEQEAAKAGVGPISSIAFQVAKAARFFNPIPVLGDYTSSLSWVADIVGNAASVFGWNAPINLAPVTRVVRANIPYASNLNKVDMSFPLSLDCSNMVSVTPGFGGTNADELDIVHLASIPFWNYSFTFDAASVVDSLLYSFYVSPGDNIKTEAYGTWTAKHMGPLQYLSTKFMYWRGSIRYRLKFVKTEFHSGRLSISYTPIDPRTTEILIPGVSSTDYVFRDIIDLRETSEFEFVVPYISSTPYKPCSDNAWTRLGEIKIYVVDQLVAPDTVPQTIPVFIEMSGGPDIEFAMVANKSYTPVADIVYQADDIECSLASKMIGTAKPGTFQLDTSQAAIGERVVSLRSLLKRFYAIEQYSEKVANKYATILPFCFQTTSPAGLLTQVNFKNDLLGELTSMYAFSRGGVRLKYIPLQAMTQGLIGFIDWSVIDPDEGIDIVTYSTQTFGNSDVPVSGIMALSTYVVSPNVENFLEVQVPQYSYTQSRSNVTLAVSDAHRYVTGTKTITPPFAVTFTGIAEYSTNRPDLDGSFIRAAADDFNLSLFVSIPPMI